jgi:hypothetical protein
VLRLGFVPDALLTVDVAGAEFYVGAMAGVDGPPPDLVTDDDTTFGARCPGGMRPSNMRERP